MDQNNARECSWKGVLPGKTARLSISFVVGTLLALSGGFMDAYSYVGRGGVFANAQTGNMIFLGIHLSQGNYAQSLIYAVPICMFVAGIALAEVFRVCEGRVGWQHVSLLVEIAAFCIVASLGEEYNMLSNVLISFVCGIQFESFRNIHGNAMATTVCMGNVRRATQLFVESVETRDCSKVRDAFIYLFITICFVVGAVVGYISVVRWGLSAILWCAGCASLALAAMLLQERGILHLRDL